MSIIPAKSRQDKCLPHRHRVARAVLHGGRAHAADRLSVSYADAAVRLELVWGSQALLSGPWQADVWLDGRLAPPVSAWEPTCRVSDPDVDYLELGIDLSGGLRLERHLVLARKDRFLLLADAVLGARTRALRYQGRLPLAPGIAPRCAEQTREGFLVAIPAGKRRRGLPPVTRPGLGRRLATVLPLALPEWRSDGDCPDFRGHRAQLGRENGTVPFDPKSEGVAGDLVGVAGALELRQAIRGRRLFAPLWLDLDRGRFRRRRTWRQLTVAESMAVLPPDAAVGYRVAAGGGQWLIYRSLAPKRNRSVLGHNLATETLVARFRRDGEVQSIIEIE